MLSFITLVILNIICASGVNILMPILVEKMVNIDGTPYITLLFAILIITIIFTITHMYYNHNKYTTKIWKYFIMSGVCEGLSRFCLVYAADPTRTPIVMQTALLGTIIFASIFVSKYIIDIDKKKTISYKNNYVYASITCLIMSIIFAMIPQFDSHSWTFSSFVWTIIFTIGIGFKACHSNLQEKYIEKTHNVMSHKITMLAYACNFQLLTTLLLMGLDITPFFGYSTPQNFNESISDSLKCYFSINCNGNFMLNMLYITLFMGLYFTSFELNAKSTNFNMLLSTVTGPIMIIFFTLFPTLNQGIEYPVYITIPIIFFNVLSVVIWKYWEFITPESNPFDHTDSDEIEEMLWVSIQNDVDKYDVVGDY